MSPIIGLLNVQRPGAQRDVTNVDRAVRRWLVRASRVGLLVAETTIFETRSRAGLRNHARIASAAPLVLHLVLAKQTGSTHGFLQTCTADEGYWLPAIISITLA